MTVDRSTAESELAKERGFTGDGVELDREIPRVSMADFDARFDEIADALWSAATDVGFFQLTDHGIAGAEIERAFAMAERFFALDPDIKARRPLRPGTNSGWEFKEQVRPSTGTTDQKESFQITIPRMEELDLWPTDDEVSGFADVMTRFERANWQLAMQVLSCLADRLGFDRAFFAARHDPASPNYQSTLRMLHYFPVEEADRSLWRAGAHTDYDCLTLLHQVPGQHGLQVCPGAEADGFAWTSVHPDPGVITCNIGDMLMRWSDDRLQSTLHRVRMPSDSEYVGPRYSLAFFAQADRDAVIQGPEGVYPPITASDYLHQRITANAL